jgi:hypothetical protein
LASEQNNKTKGKSAKINLMPVIILFGVFGLILAVCVAKSSSPVERKIFSVSFLSLLAGLLIESFRVSNNWKKVVAIFVATFFFCLLSFSFGLLKPDYNNGNQDETWSYCFILLFALAFAIAHKSKVTIELTEGVTLLQSLAFIYWTTDYGLTNYHNWFVILLVSIGFLLSAFSIVNALTYTPLTKTKRLILSIWSTIMMLAFAIDNITRVFNNPDLESSEYISEGLYIGLQYFLLGVSAVYIMQNYILLISFLPNKNGNSKQDFEDNKQTHISRFSDKQVYWGHALFCILYAGLSYGLNYKYRILPRHTMIWLTFFTFPLILQLKNLVIYLSPNKK